jgi:soluble lytic murein transglycosylase
VWIFAFVVALVGSLVALSGMGEILHAEPIPASPSEQVSPPSAAAATPTKPEPSDALHFSVSSLRLPSDSPETRCVMALGAGNLDECKRIALEALPTAVEPSLGRMRYLLARASAKDPLASRPVLEELAKSRHALAAVAKLRLAEMLRDPDPHASLRWTEELLQDSRWKNRLEPLRASLLAQCGRMEEAEQLLREMVREAPESSTAAPASMTLAAILADRPDVASRKQALTLYRRVYTRAPLTATGEQARQLAVQVLTRLPTAERESNQQSFADAKIEADSFFAARAWARARSAYSSLEKKARTDRAKVCEAELGQAKTLLQMRKPGEAAGILGRVVADCTDPEVKAHAHHHYARAILRQGDPFRALGHFEAAARLAPDDRVAHEALLAASTSYLELDDPAGARRVLAELLDRPKHPPDVRANARFALAWLERQTGDLDAALAQLSQLTAEGPHETTEDMFGRAAYWHARTLLDQRQYAAASAEFMELFRSRPLTYYSQQGIARLQEFDPTSAKLLLDELRDTAPRKGIWLSVQPELKTPEFERAVELLRVGEPSRAQEELNAIGVFERNSSDELFLIGSAVLQQFGAQVQSTTLMRRRVGSIMRMPPRGEARGLWRIAFPQAYYPLIEDVAGRAGVPAAFVRAIAREESSFDPRAVSSANAYGLIQLISSTAKAYGRPMRLKHDPASLKTPEINLRIGTAFMRDLFERYRDNPALVPAAYNAGAGSCERWLRERPTVPLDEWIEMIPYFETRRYTRRVLQTYGVYSWLDSAQLPSLRRKLPGSPQQALDPNDAVTLLDASTPPDNGR